MSKVSPVVKAIEAEMRRQEIGVPELADRARLALSAVYRMFKGETDPNLDSVEALLKVLNLKIKVGKR